MRIEGRPMIFLLEGVRHESRNSLDYGGQSQTYHDLRGFARLQCLSKKPRSERDS